MKNLNMRIVLCFFLVLLLSPVGCSCATVPESIPVSPENSQVVPFKLTSWFGEKSSSSVSFGHLTFGDDKYEYKGKIEVGNNTYRAELDKKLWRVVRLDDMYYFICLFYYSEPQISIYRAPANTDNSELQKVSIADVPDAVLLYDFIPVKTDDKYDGLRQLLQYRANILRELMNANEIRRMTYLLDFFVTKASYSAEFCGNGLWTRRYLSYLAYRIKEKGISEDDKAMLFDVLVKMLYNIPKENYYPDISEDIAWFLLRFDPAKGKKILLSFLDYYENNNSIPIDEAAKKSVIRSINFSIKNLAPQADTQAQADTQVQANSPDYLKNGPLKHQDGGAEASDGGGYGR